MPIIKSKGRKDRDYAQLVKYMFQHDHEQEFSFTHFHNVSGNKEDDIEGIVNELSSNAELKSKRKGGIGMYHEMISFAPEDSEYLKLHPEILEDIAEHYMELRVGNSMGIAKPHLDKNHLHIHFCFTPNEKGNSKSIRMSKVEFQKVRRQIENYQLEHYPELTHSYVHMRDFEKNQSSSRNQKEWGMDQRKAKRTRKEELAKRVSSCIHFASTLEDITHNLESSGLQPYYRRGVLQGVLLGKRKYRLTTLLRSDTVLYEVVYQLQNKEKQNRSMNRGL